MDQVRTLTVLESSAYNNKLNGKNSINLKLSVDPNNNNSVSYVKPSNDKDAVESKATNFLYEYFGIKFKSPIKWFNSVAIIILHIIGTYGLIYYIFKVTPLTILWAFVCGGIGGFGVTGGAHRFWCHRAFKAKLPLRIILMLCYTVAGQNTLYDWVRDHRVHHKYSETEADPHDSNRGFFFAHVGWLMLKKHPEVIKKGNQIDMSDVLSDPVVQFHQKFFIPMKILFCFLLPSIIPVYFWGEKGTVAFFSQAVIRYLFGLNFTWLVNSAAHMWGYKPYDKNINPVENWGVSIVAMGEGWHNYHHVFPWDYKAAELGNYKMNITTFWLDFFAKIGWAYDLKQPSKELIKRTIEKHGDGSHPVWGDHHSSVKEVPEPKESETHLYEYIDKTK